MKKFIILLVITFSFGANIEGSGATSVSEVIKALAQKYYKRSGVDIEYISIGSAGGIKQVLRQKTDFAVTEIEYKLKDNSLQLIPFLSGNIVIAYNLEGVEDLVLNTDVLAKIYLGKIRKWNDKEIKKLNPNLDLPDKKITAIHRYDGSGTTLGLTKFLSEANEEWKDKHGVAMALDWDTGIGKKGNQGIADFVKETPDSVGYVTHSYALDLNLTTAKIAFNDRVYSARDIGYPLVILSYFFLETNAKNSKDVRRFIDFIYRNGDTIILENGLSPLIEKPRISIN